MRAVRVPQEGNSFGGLKEFFFSARRHAVDERKAGGMDTRITGHLRTIEQAVKNNPGLRSILERDEDTGLQLLSRHPLQTYAVLAGFDVLGLIHRTSKIVEENHYDGVKVRRRIEEYLRKYADDRTLIGLAVFLGVPID